MVINIVKGEIKWGPLRGGASKWIQEATEEVGLTHVCKQVEL